MTSTLYTNSYYNELLSDLEFVTNASEIEVCAKFNADSKSEFLEVLMAEIEEAEEAMGTPFYGC